MIKIMKMKKLVTIACAFVMTLSICAVPAFAANVQDTSYYFTNSTTESWRVTNHRYKQDASKVYVYAYSSPSGKTLTHTDCYVGGSVANETAAGNVYLRDNHKYAITNFVYERGDYTTNRGVEMFLDMKPNSGSGTLSGVWSPDWTGTGSKVTIV